MLPGVVALEMARAAAVELGKPAHPRLSAVVWERPVIVDRARTVRLRLEPAGDGLLFSLVDPEAGTTHVRGALRYPVPQIICGDFNIDRYSANETYQQMLDILHAKDADVETGAFSYDRVANDLDVEPGTKRELIDFILTRENASNVQRVKHAIKIFKQRWHSNHQDLSDHYAIETKIEFRNDVTFVTASWIP